MVFAQIVPLCCHRRSNSAEVLPDHRSELSSHTGANATTIPPEPSALGSDHERECIRLPVKERDCTPREPRRLRLAWSTFSPVSSAPGESRAPELRRWRDKNRGASLRMDRYETERGRRSQPREKSLIPQGVWKTAVGQMFWQDLVAGEPAPIGTTLGPALPPPPD